MQGSKQSHEPRSSRDHGGVIDKRRIPVKIVLVAQYVLLPNPVDVDDDAVDL